MSEVTEVPAVEPTTDSLQPAAVVEEQTTDTPQSSESAPETQEQETKPQETEEQRKTKFQRRIERKNADLAAARTEARMLRERLEAMEAQARPQVQRDSQAPKLEQFDNFEDYMAARVAYDAEKVVEARLSRAQQEDAQRRQNETQARNVENWRDQQARAAEKYPDYEEVVGGSDAPITREMSQAIIESDQGAEITYYLAHHPDEAKSIALLSPIRQIAAIGKLEAKLSQPPPKKVTEAPPPITPAGSKAKAEKQPHEMTPKEFNEWRRRVIAQRR